MYYDLHTHTTASDGILTPEQIIDNSINIGLLGVAITDHDTIDGLEVARNYNKTKNNLIEFIPGIEMNTEVDEYEVHILGYFIDDKNQTLRKRLQEIREYRYERAQKMISKLRSMGFQITLEQVSKLAQGDLIGRPHIAQALIDKNYVFSLKEAFDKYISKGRPAYVPRYKFLPNEAIELIKNAGGIPVLAHPGLIKEQSLILKIIDMGLQGIEVYYPEHTHNQIKLYTELSSKHNLVITGGSDFHGTNNDHSRSRLGCMGINSVFMRKVYERQYKKD